MVVQAQVETNRLVCRIYWLASKVGLLMFTTGSSGHGNRDGNREVKVHQKAMWVSFYAG